MKRKVQSACVEDVDPQTEEVVQGTQHSASIFPPAEGSRERQKVWRKSGEHLYECHDSQDLGPLLEYISGPEGQGALTIIAGKHDDNKEVWAEYEEVTKKLSQKHRILYLQDNIINGESKTYTERTTPISKELDLLTQNPSLILAQRTICPRTSRVLLKAHLIRFGARLDLDRPYIFSRLGDELPGLSGSSSRPDLHITFHGIRDWDSVAKRLNFVGYDRNVVLEVSGEDVRAGKRVMFDLGAEQAGRVVDEEVEGKPALGVAVDAGLFRTVLGTDGGGGGAGKVSNAYYPAGQKAKKRRFEAGSPIFSLKIIGVGPGIPGHSFKADINVEFVLTP